MFQSLTPAHRASHGNGFTLVELMVVIAVMATLVALTAPSFKRMIDLQRLRSVNAALITDMQFARSEAASRNQLVLVRFDKTGSALTCYVILAGDHTACNCKNVPGTNVCTGATREIRTVQVDRSLGITVGVPVAQTITTMGFDPATGRLMVAPIDLPEPASVPFLIEVKNDSLGGFVTSMEITGRPTVCSPGGTVSGVNACP